MNAGMLHHLEFYVEDLHASRAFWSAVLENIGWQKFQVWDKGISWIFDNGPYIVFAQVTDPHKEWKNNRQAQGFNHMAFNAGSIEKLVSTAEIVEDCGGKVLKQKPGYLCFEGPDDLVCELFLDS